MVCLLFLLVLSVSYVPVISAIFGHLPYYLPSVVETITKLQKYGRVKNKKDTSEQELTFS